MIDLIAIGVCLLIIGYRVLNWAWLRPKRLEKCLREQGLRGNPYRLFRGDQYESGKLIGEAWSKPIGIDDDIKKRALPHILNTIDKHGERSFMWVGRTPRVHVTEPELVREVLTKYTKFHKNLNSFDPITQLLVSGIVSLEGEQWPGRRRILNPAFHFDKLKLMLPAFKDSSENMIDRWKKIASSSNQEVDAWPHMEGLAGDVIARTLFGSDYEEGKKIFDLIKELIVLSLEVIQTMPIPGQRFLPTKRNKRMRAINSEVKVRITEIIRKKTKAMKAREGKEDDLLGILLKCNNEEIQQNRNNQSDGGVAMSIEEIIDECKIFFFAGQDTTSSLLVWTMVLLSRHPEWQDRAREEVMQTFGDKEPDYAGISSLKIVTMILYEVLRLYPPVFELTKVAQEDLKLGDLFIPKGVHLMLPTILLQHDPKIWGDDVMEFKPERFSDGVLKASKVQGSYFPFSLGPRMCIGQNYALLAVKLAMALVLKHFTFEFSPSYVHAPCTFFTLQPQHGAHLILHNN